MKIDWKTLKVIKAFGLISVNFSAAVLFRRYQIQDILDLRLISSQSITIISVYNY